MGIHPIQNMAILSELTDEEKSLIPKYCEFWYEVAVSTSKLNHSQVKESIYTLYARLDLKAPRIHFCTSLPDLIRKSHKFVRQPSFCEDGNIFASQEMARIHEMYYRFVCDVQTRDMRLSSQLGVIDGGEIEIFISLELSKLLIDFLPASFAGYEKMVYWIFPRLLYVDESCWLDFHFSAVRRLLAGGYDEMAWQDFRQLVEVGSWMTVFESDCFVCERPCRITLDSGSASLDFDDGEHLSLEKQMSEDLPTI
jgi:hypothetical protein